MLAACQASLWRWLQRDDCTAPNRYIGYWQVSRVYSLLGVPELAMRYAELCFSDTPDDLPVYMGFAHELLCRAVLGGGQSGRASEQMEIVRTAAQ